MRIAFRAVASLLIGMALLLPLGALYGAASLPVYHSWGLVHGSFTTAVPALVLASYTSLGYLPWFGPAIDSKQRLIASCSVLVLVTLLFYADEASQHAFSWQHLAIYFSLAVMFTSIAVRANRPNLLPLFLLVPLCADPLFGFAITAPYGGPAVEILGHDLMSKILPAALAMGAAILLTAALRRREA